MKKRLTRDKRVVFLTDKRTEKRLKDAAAKYNITLSMFCEDAVKVLLSTLDGTKGKEAETAGLD